MTRVRRQDPKPDRRGHSLTELLVVFGIIMLVAGMIITVLIQVYRIIESWKG